MGHLSPIFPLEERLIFDTQAVKDRLRDMHMSQRQLADMADTYPSNVSNMLSGKQLPSLPTLARMGNALQTDPREWLIWK